MCFAQVSMAQYAIWKAGVGFHSENIFSSNWNNAITATNPSTNMSAPPLSWGWGWSISSDYLVKEGLAVGLKYGGTYYGKTDVLGTQTTSSDAKFHDFTVYGDFYILKYVRNMFLPHFQENFFVRAAPSYHTSSVTTEGTNITATDTLQMQGLGGSSGFGLGLGLGYSQYVTDKISVTGILNMNFGMTMGVSDLPYSNMVGSEGITGSSNSFMTRLSAEVKVAYAIKQKKPLCPISSCSVQQEHSHAVLGGAVVRGNSYKYRQNQKYGDIHRGQVDKSKRKKTKSEREQQKLQKKEKRNRKRIRIIGAGH